MRFSCVLGIGVLAMGCGGGNTIPIDDDSGTVPDASSGSDGPTGDASPHEDAAVDAADAADGHVGSPNGGRLIVTQQKAGVGVWDHVTALAADTAPTFTMTDPSVASGASGALVVGSRLIVGPSGAGLVAFDDATTFGASAAPSAVVPFSAFIAPSGTNGISNVTQSLSYDDATDTLWARQSWGADRFDAGKTLSSSSKGVALFSHPWFQLPSFIYDPNGDRAFSGQISGAGLLVWNGAKSAIGSPAKSFQLANVALWSLALAGDRLYGLGNDGHEGVNVWSSISSDSTSKVADFKITTGFAQNDFSPYVGVTADTLVVCVQSGKVLVWKNASKLSGDKAPDFTLTSSLAQPLKAVLATASDRLYVLDTEGVAIFSNATSAPTFVAKIKTGLAIPQDIAVIE